MTDKPEKLTAQTMFQSSLFGHLTYLGIISVSIFILCFLDLGFYGFFDSWEGIYAQSAREMAERGSYLVPYYRGDPRLAKPVLAYWGIMLSNALFGESEFSARLPGAVAAALCALLVYYAMCRLKNRWTAFVTTMVMLTSMHYYIVARRSTPDVYITVFTGAGAALLMLGIFKEKLRTTHLLMAYIAISLAFLGKGPIAVIIPVFGLLLYLILMSDLNMLVPPDMRKNMIVGLVLFCIALFILGAGIMYHMSFYMDDYFSPPRWLRFLQQIGHKTTAFSKETGMAFWYYPAVVLISLAISIPGYLKVKNLISREKIFSLETAQLRIVARQLLLFAAVFLVIGVSWYLYIIIESHGKFGKKFLLTYNVEAFFTKVSNDEKSNYYVKSVIFGFFPWYVFLPASFFALLRFRKERPVLRHCPEVMSLCFVLAGAVFFCMATTKFYHYFAPVVALMALPVGFYLGEYAKENDRAHYPLGFITALLFFLPTARELLRYCFHYMTKLFAVNPYYYMPRVMQKPMIQVSTIIFAIMAVALLIGIFTRKRKSVVVILLLASLWFAHSFNQLILLPLGWVRSPKPVFEAYTKLKPKDASYAINMGLYQPCLYYSNLQLVQLKRNTRAITKWFSSASPQFCIAGKGTDLKQLNQVFKDMNKNLYIVYEDHTRYVIVSDQPVTMDQPD